MEGREEGEAGVGACCCAAEVSVTCRWSTVLVSVSVFFPSDLQFQFEVGLLIAATLSSLVCLSRLYTGMHSVLVSKPLTHTQTHKLHRIKLLRSTLHL